MMFFSCFFLEHETLDLFWDYNLRSQKNNLQEHFATRTKEQLNYQAPTSKPTSKNNSYLFYLHILPCLFSFHFHRTRISCSFYLCSISIRVVQCSIVQILFFCFRWYFYLTNFLFLFHTINKCLKHLNFFISS